MAKEEDKDHFIANSNEIILPGLKYLNELI